MLYRRVCTVFYRANQSEIPTPNHVSNMKTLHTLRSYELLSIDFFRIAAFFLVKLFLKSIIKTRVRVVKYR